MEARWYHSGYTQTLEEYIRNGSTSLSVPVILGHLYFSAANPITKEAMEYIAKFPDVIRGSALVLHLSDDLRTSSVSKPPSPPLLYSNKNCCNDNLLFIFLICLLG